jgi:hypothetical protein
MMVLVLLVMMMGIHYRLDSGRWRNGHSLRRVRTRVRMLLISSWCERFQMWVSRVSMRMVVIVIAAHRHA